MCAVSKEKRRKGTNESRTMLVLFQLMAPCFGRSNISRHDPLLLVSSDYDLRSLEMFTTYPLVISLYHILTSPFHFCIRIFSISLISI